MHTKFNSIIRCPWCRPTNAAYVAYHDKEWGIPHHHDPYLFEMLVLETFQAGLSWECVLNKREAFRQAFARFDATQVAAFTPSYINELLTRPDLIRHRGKMEATVNNARIFLDIQREWGSFDHYIWHFTERKTIIEHHRTTSPLSDSVAHDLKRRGMKFMGSTTVYSYLQAIGILNGHHPDCFLYSKEILLPL